MKVVQVSTFHNYFPLCFVKVRGTESAGGNNMGYIGHSRSVRSAYAIEDGEMPLTMFNKKIMEEVIEENNFTNCQNLSVAFVKFVAKKEGCASWHHTSKYFNETNHYDFIEILKTLNDINVQSEYKKRYDEVSKNKKEKEIVKTNDEMIQLVSFVEDVWEGSRNYPKKVEYPRVGVKSGDWIYTDITLGKFKKVSATAKKNHSITVHKTIRTLKCSEYEKKQLTTIKKELKKKER